MYSKLRCPKCGSSQTRYRIKTKDGICYHCGNVYSIPKEGENSE